MSHYNIAVISGDGVGPEVINEGKKALQALSAPTFTFTDFGWSSDYYRQTGRFIPEGGLDEVANYDAILFGAVGDAEIQDHITLNNLILPIRRRFDQYACVRPGYLYDGVQSPLAGKSGGDIDLVVLRENTEGEYANVGGFQYKGFPEEVGIQTGVFTRKGCERVIRYSFDLARRRNKKTHVTSVTKSNAQGYGMLVWDQAFERVASEFPDISTDSLLVDAAAMDFIRKPEVFDVVVGSNLFGDILTDIGAIITGSMGLASSANLDPEGRHPSMFEPVHGSAPDIMGQGIANPLAQILTGAMMVRHLGHENAASDIENAVQHLLTEGEILTPDLGGSSSTQSVGDAVINALGK